MAIQYRLQIHIVCVYSYDVIPHTIAPRYMTGAENKDLPEGLAKLHAWVWVKNISFTIGEEGTTDETVTEQMINLMHYTVEPLIRDPLR